MDAEKAFGNRMESSNEGATDDPIKAMDRCRIVLDFLCAKGVRTPFNFFRTPTTYVVVSLVDPMGRKHQQQATGPDIKWYEETLWDPSMEFRLDDQGEAGLLLVLELELMFQQSNGGDFSVGSASFPISELRAKKNSSRKGERMNWIRRSLRASNGKKNGTIEIRCEIISCPDHAQIPNETDLAQLVEKAGKSESTSEEDGAFIFDTAVGKIDLSNLQVIDNKDIVELKELGSGAFGTVYHGKWKGNDVAIKRIKKNCFTSQQDRLILESLKEAGILANLLHPNVVSLYGFVLDELGSSTLAIVMELVADGSLGNILRRKDKYLDHYRKLIIAKGAASGMEYLHLKKIVHFDLKCDNLLVDLKDPSSPICKVADFGLSKVKQDTLVSGGFRGTIPWMAPELLKGDQRKVSEKVDVFSFGIVMWEILTGEVPYAGMLEGEIIGGIYNDTLRPPVPTSCEPRWRRLMEECWASDPQERPSFTQIARRLHSLLVASHTKVRQ